MDTFITSLTFGLGAFVSTFIGGQLALRFKSLIKPLIAFSGGTLIAVAMLDLIPETLEIQEGRDTILIMAQVLGGFLFFHLIEKIIFVHGHSHSHQDENKGKRTVGKFSALGFILHSFIDGIAIGTGFLVDPSIGFVIAAAVLLHGFSDGINTVTLLLKNEHNKRTALIFLIIGALAPLSGVICANIIKLEESALGSVLAVFAGFFLYIGATDLLPEAHKERASLKLVGFTILGVIVVSILRTFIH